MFKNLAALSVVVIAMAAAANAGAQKAPKHVKAHRFLAQHYVGAARAGKSALAKYHGKVVGKIALENEDGKMQYSVNVLSGKTMREVMVDARSGKIASVEVTTKAEEAKEAAAEHKALGKRKAHPKKK